MNARRFFIFSALAWAAWTVAAPCSDLAGSPLRAVATTSLVEAGLRDLLGSSVEIVRLLPAGSCPGHFDLQPEHAEALARADVFVRHDFQAALERAAERVGVLSDRTVVVTSRPAFTIPSNYVAMCRELAEEIGRRRPEWKDYLEQRISAIEQEAGEAEAKALARAAAWHGRRVLAAHYQRDFCQWLGLTVVAVFNAGTDESAWLFNRAVDMARNAGAEAVIGNLQWGTKHLSALCEATRLPGAMFSNFPSDGEAGAVWRLLDANLSALEGIWNDARR